MLLLCKKLFCSRHWFILACTSLLSIVISSFSLKKKSAKSPQI
nr:MAG TPA: hypothetical protein [Caudoviricetes sp.]